MNKFNDFHDLIEAEYDYSYYRNADSIRFRLQFLIIKLAITIKLFTIIKKIIFIMIKMIIMIKKSLYETKEHLEMMFIVLKVNYKGQYFEEGMKDEFKEN